MITVVSSPQKLTGTLGLYDRVCCQFRTTESNVGQAVCFDVAMFATSPTLTPNGNTNQYKLLYPAVGSPVPMKFLGSPTNQNHSVTIEALDEYNYVICLDFLWLNDINGYLADSIRNNYAALNGGFSGKYLNMYSEINGEGAVCANPASMNSFCVDNVSFNTEFFGGFCANEDLKVFVSIDQLGISNNFYAGFVQHNSIGNNLPFVVDSQLSYGLIGNGVTADDLPVTCLKDGEGFIGSAGSSYGTVTIDGSCLNSGGKYCLYVVYQKNGEWHSCISDPICQTLTKPLPAITADIFCCSLTDGIGNTHDNCCVSGIAPCGTVEYCVELKKDVLQAALVESGYAGTVDDYFSYGSINLGTSANSSPIITDTTIKLCTRLNVDDLQGNIDALASFTFDFDGYVETIQLESDIGITGTVVEASPAFTLDGEEVAECFCCGGEGTLAFDSLGDCTYLLSTGFGEYQNIGTTPSFDVSLLECGTVHCIKAVCEGEVEEEEDCDCPPCEPISINIAVDDQSSDQFIDVQINANGCLIEYTWGSMTGSNNDVINLEIPWNFVPTGIADSAIVLKITKQNGCEYGYTLGGLFNLDTFASTHNGDKALLGNGNQDCDCPEECDKVNTAYVEYECDENGITSYNVVENFESTGATTDDTVEELDDDGNLVKVYVNKTFTPDDGCPPVTIEQVISCLPVAYCVNSRLVEHELNEECTELVLTLTDSFDSPVISDKFYIRINGATIEYDLFNGDTIPSPISVGDGDEVCWWSTIQFDDNCADTVLDEFCFIVECEAEPTECDYSGFTVTCAFQQGALVDGKCEIGTYTVTSADGPATLIKDSITWCLNNGKELPYLKPVNGNGQFVVTRCIQIEGCEPHFIYDYCSSIPLSDINIKSTIEIPPIEIPPIEIPPIEIPPVVFPECLGVEIKNWDDMPTCCDECCDEVVITCSGCVLTATAECPEGVTPAYLWSTGETTPAIEVEESGDYTVVVSSEGCDDIEATYTYTKLEGGTTIEDS